MGLLQNAMSWRCKVWNAGHDADDVGATSWTKAGISAGILRCVIDLLAEMMCVIRAHMR